MKTTITLFMILWATATLFAQEKTIKLTGKPIVTIFANYQAGLKQVNNISGFELERSYLGYQFSVTEQLSGKVVLDIGPSKVTGSDLERIAYIKNAMLIWKTGNFSLDFGLIGLEQFNIQEKFWGYRYIWKSFQDHYKFGSSADMGITGRYKFTEWLSTDVTFINGEGYKKLNKDNNYRYGAGITIQPLKSITLRAYYDQYDGRLDKSQQALALFAGYQHTRFRIGAEYNKLTNVGFIADQEQTGYSGYASISLFKKINLFGRYDELSSKNDYFSGDQNRALAGLEYVPNKYLKLSPNFQTIKPRIARTESYLFLNVEFKL